MADRSDPQYDHARNAVGGRYRFTDDDGHQIEGEVVDWKPCELVNAETGNRPAGTVRFVVRDDDRVLHESTCYAPARN